MKYVILFILALAFLNPVFTYAQKPASSPEICKGAQVWYDSIDSAEVANLVEVSLDPKADQLDRIKASTEIYNISQRLEDVKLPDCLKPAQKAYIKGLAKLSAAAAMALPPYYADQQEIYPIKLAYSQRMIGEARGYLLALGVTLEVPIDPDPKVTITDESNILIYK